MKHKLLSLGAVAFLAMQLSTSAAVIQLLALPGVPGGALGPPPGPNGFLIAKNGTGIGNGNSNNEANQLYRLNTWFLPGPDVSGPVLRLDSNGEFNAFANGNLPIFSFAIAHYGNGAFPNVPNRGGGYVAAWDLNGMDGFNIPRQGLSTLDLIGPRRTPPPRTNNVPDGGTTSILLAASLLGMGAVRRKMQRR